MAEWKNEDTISKAAKRGQELLKKSSIEEAEKAFEEAYGLLFAHYTEIHAYCVRNLTPHDAVAYETTQDIFTGVWKGLPTFGFKSTWRTWVYSIARHCIADSVGLVVQDREVFQETTETDPQVQTHPLENVPDTRPEPETLYNQEEERRLYEQALSCLAKDDRTILRMYYTYKDSMKKIADILEMPLSTAYRRRDEAEKKCIDIIRHLIQGNDK